MKKEKNPSDDISRQKERMLLLAKHVQKRYDVFIKQCNDAENIQKEKMDKVENI